MIGMIHMNIKIAWQDLHEESFAWVGNYRLSVSKPKNTENVYWVYVDLIWPDNHYTQIYVNRNEANTLKYAQDIVEQQLIIALHSGLVTNER